MHPFYEVNNSGDQNFFTASFFTNFNFPPHLHPYVEIVYVLEGSFDVTINNLPGRINKGDIAISFPNDIHGYKTETYSKIMMFIFSPEIAGAFFNKRMDKTLENPFIPAHVVSNGIDSLFHELNAEYKNCNNKYVIKGLLYTILGRLDAHFILKSSKNFYNNTTQSLLKYIESHFHENISLESTANALGFSKYYLSRIFSNKIGYQFNDYINRLRINRAQKLLSETDLSISNVALDCGFESQRNFNRIFKELTFTTPTEFRSNILKNNY